MDVVSAVDTSGKDLPCKNLTRRAPVQFPKELLLGKERNFSMHSGYVNVTHEDYLFYWFVEAVKSTYDDAPLIIWSNGGPGCSGMEGATTEHGPYVLHDVKESHMMFNGRLTHNPYSWNYRAHVLYVDQPRYVGFSCGTGPKVMSSREAGKDMVQFLLGWRELFPEHKHRNIIFASESYGGHYVPAWTEAVMEFNDKASFDDQLRLKGIALGNAAIDKELQGTKPFVTFLKRHTLIPEETNPSTKEEARRLMQKTLGYNPNYYNYGLVDLECCGCYSYNYSTWGHWLMKKEVQEALNVCGNAGDNTFGGCHGGCMDGVDDFDAHDTFDYVGALGRALKSGIKVTMFYGMLDTACDYVGGYAVANALEWPGAEDFRQAELQELHIGGDVAGQSQSGGGLSWVQILGAGHMVEVDNPAASAYAIDMLILETSNPKADRWWLEQSLTEGVPFGRRRRAVDSKPQQQLLKLTLALCMIISSGVLVATAAKRLRTRPQDCWDDGYIRVEA